MLTTEPPSQCLLWTGVGIRWDNLGQPTNEDTQFTMANIYTMLGVNILVHSLIFWYLDGLLPGDFGTPKPVCFPFTVVALLDIFSNSLAAFLQNSKLAELAEHANIFEKLIILREKFAVCLMVIGLASLM